MKSTLGHMQLNPPTLIDITYDILKNIQNTILQNQSGVSLMYGIVGSKFPLHFPGKLS